MGWTRDSFDRCRNGRAEGVTARIILLNDKSVGAVNTSAGVDGPGPRRGRAAVAASRSAGSLGRLVRGECAGLDGTPQGMPPAVVAGESLGLAEDDAGRDTEVLRELLDVLTVAAAGRAGPVLLGNEEPGGEMICLLLGFVCVPFTWVPFKVEAFGVVKKNVAELMEEGEPQLVVALEQERQLDEGPPLIPVGCPVDT